jgi:hypothetical protein
VLVAGEWADWPAPGAAARRAGARGDRTTRSAGKPDQLRTMGATPVVVDGLAAAAVRQKLGIGSAETLRKWVRQSHVDAGQRPGVSTEECTELRRLRRPPTSMPAARNRARPRGRTRDR